MISVIINKDFMLYFQQKRIITFFEKTMTEIYNEGNISPSMAIVLSQLFHYSLHPSIKNLYYKGYELLFILIEQKTQMQNNVRFD
jgi:hypothetical protein